jgi:hypothetical protein
MDDDSLSAIKSALWSLPDDFSGCFDASGRSLTVIKNKTGTELQLMITMRDATSGDPLLHAQVRWPPDPSAAPIIISLRHLSGGQFRSKERKYLQAMTAWARDCLAGPEPVQLQPLSSNRSWERHLRAFITAIAGDRGRTARSFFEERGRNLSHVDNYKRVLDAAYYLRDRGMCIHHLRPTPETNYFQGFNTDFTDASKSDALRVTRVRACTCAVAAISASIA